MGPGMQGQPSPNYDFNQYAAGNKTYGMGRSNPTMGPVDKLGYAERDRQAVARRNALLQRLQQIQQANMTAGGM